MIRREPAANGSQHPEGLRREVALVGLQLRRRWDLTHALFFLRVAAALAAVARRLRVAAPCVLPLDVSLFVLPSDRM